MKTRHIFYILALVAAVSCGRKLEDGEYTFHLLTTNDIHSSWFDSSYMEEGAKRSIFALNHYIDSVRTSVGSENVMLLDAGDCLQGDNAAYFFNYVDTTDVHLFTRLTAYMKYDAVAVGNHDIETGHPVYDRVTRELADAGIPFLGGNAIRNDNGKPYFPLYEVYERAGLKVAVVGYTNANMKAWLTESLWSGMTFKPVMDQVQGDIDSIRKKEKPDVVIVLMHSGTGKGDGSILESEALDVFNSVKGIDFLVCGHDHSPRIEAREDAVLLNTGSHSRNLGHGILHVKVENGTITSKEFSSELIPVKAEMADPAMKEAFRPDFEKVKAFTLREVGVLNTDLRTRDAYTGMSDYINLIHTLSLGCEPAEISFAAPLTYNGFIPQGVLVYNDLFTIYPYENQLFVVKMSGAKVKEYLENSYNKWIKTISGPNDHVLNIRQRDDARTGQEGWSFIERSYNFDSAGGINYTVDVTKPYGQRIAISSMADGTPFDESRTYNVAMTSYRASGGGDLMTETGFDTDNIDEIVVERYPEIRNILYNYLVENGSIDPEKVGDASVIGHWEFVPESVARPALENDRKLLFRD